MSGLFKRSFFANNRTASLLHIFINEIMSIGKRNGVKVMSYAPSTVRKRIAGNGRASKEELSGYHRVKVSRIESLFISGSAWKNQHHQNMFDAIGLGLMASED